MRTREVERTKPQSEVQWTLRETSNYGRNWETDNKEKRGEEEVAEDEEEEVQ